MNDAAAKDVKFSVILPAGLTNKPVTGEKKNLVASKKLIEGKIKFLKIYTLCSNFLSPRP